VRPPPDAQIADLGCGYGRHLRALAARGARRLVGVDLSELLLDEARKEAPSARLLRADLRALPLRSGSLGAALCFYSSMFLGTEADAAQALREAARALRPGARLLLTTDNPLRLAQRPHESWQEDVAGLGSVREESAFDPATGVDEVRRTVQEPGGKTLSATFRIRYYPPDRLASLAGAAGLSFLRLEPDAPLSASTPQLIAVFARSP
jgi:SAM-dependent methyltransferase